MSHLKLMIFYLIFFGIYFSGNLYVFIRGWQALPGLSAVRLAYSLLFWLLAISFMISRLTGKENYFGIHHVSTWVGSYWLIMVLYFFFAVFIIDIVRLANILFHFLPESGSFAYTQLKSWTFMGIVTTVCLLVIAGSYNARQIKMNRIQLKINKEGGEFSKLRIIMASDIHLGTLIHDRRLYRLVQTINQENPDIILFPGDILDEELSPIIREDIGKPLRNLKASLGVWAVPGNHEYIGNYERASAYIKTLNIKLLKDNTVLIRNSFYLVGRDDRDASRFNGTQRKELTELMHNIDLSKPIILLNHQPYNLQESVVNKIDLQLSGHTHHGQFWPFNFLTSHIFEVSRGYLQKGSFQIYVSTGFGTWGPPVRLGNRPEIVILEIDFIH